MSNLTATENQRYLCYDPAETKDRKQHAFTSGSTCFKSMRSKGPRRCSLPPSGGEVCNSKLYGVTANNDVSHDNEAL